MITFDPRHQLVRCAKFSLLAGMLISSSISHGQTWNTNVNGNWGTAGNWTPASVPNASGATANLTFNATGTRTVTIDTTSRTVGILNIGDSNTTHSYLLTASGGASLIFDNGGSTAQLNQNATSFGDTISAPISLASDLSISNAS